MIDVADDEHVGAARDAVELRGVVAFGQRDAERLELRAHRRVDVRVAAGDRVAGRARDRGEPAHERAADAEDVEVHGAIGRGSARPPRANGACASSRATNHA